MDGFYDKDSAPSKTSLTGIPVSQNMTSTEKMWNAFSAIGDIAFAYAFSTVLLEIQAIINSIFFALLIHTHVCICIYVYMQMDVYDRTYRTH